jgi:hypothetical protein
MEKYCKARRVTDDNVTHAHCMLVTKATNTEAEYVIVTAFPLYKWLNESPSVLLYVHCLSCLM